jgi:antigen flippase
MDSAAPGRRVRPIALSLGASIGIQGLNLLTGVLIARILGPAGRGELTAVILWPTIVALAGSAGFIEAATYQAAVRRYPYDVVVGTTLLLVAVETVVLLAAAAAVIPLALRNYPPHVLTTAFLFVLYVPLNVLTLHMMAILNGAQRFVAFHALRLTVIAASAIGLGSLALADSLDLRGAALVYLGANLAVCAAATTLVLHRLAARPRPRRGLLRELVGFGLKSNVSNVSTLLNERLDQLVISAFLSPVQLGLYVVAVTFTSVSTLLGYSVSSVALPVVAKLTEERARRRAARRYVRITFLGTAALALPAIVATPAIVDFVFGRAFHGSASLARILLVASVLLATGRVLGSVLKAVNRPLDAGIGELAGLAVTVASLAVLLPAVGLTGAAVASLLAYGTTMAWLTYRTARALDLGVADLLLPARAWPFKRA